MLLYGDKESRSFGQCWIYVLFYHSMDYSVKTFFLASSASASASALAWTNVTNSKIYLHNVQPYIPRINVDYEDHYYYQSI